MSHTEIPPGPEPIEPRRVRRNRLLYGCGGVALGVLIVVIVLIAVFVGWLRTPGLPLEARRLVDPRTILYAELHVRSEDAIAVEFLLEAFGSGTMEEAAPDEQMPAPMRWVFGSAARGPSAADLEKTLPLIVMVVRQDAGPGQRPPALLALSFPKLGNRIRLVGWFFSFFAGWGKDESKLKSEDYRDETILNVDDEKRKVWASFVGSDFLLARSPVPVRWAIDRIRERRTEEEAAPEPPLLAERPVEAMIYVATPEGHAPWAIDLIRRGAPEFAAVLEPLIQDAGAFRLWARLETRDRLTGEMHVGAGSPGEEEADEYGGRVTAVTPGGDLTFELEPLPKAAGERHAWRLSVTGLEGVGPGMIRHLDRDGRR